MNLGNYNILYSSKKDRFYLALTKKLSLISVEHLLGDNVKIYLNLDVADDILFESKYSDDPSLHKVSKLVEYILNVVGIGYPFDKYALKVYSFCNTISFGLRYIFNNTNKLLVKKPKIKDNPLRVQIGEYDVKAHKYHFNILGLPPKPYYYSTMLIHLRTLDEFI